MGQYYIACFLDTDNREKVVSAMDTEAIEGGWIGCKLMEHSYIGNAFVNDVASRLVKSPKRLVWAGDYGDEVVGDDNYHSLGLELGYLEQEDPDKAKAALASHTVYIDHDRKEWFDLSKQNRPCERGWHGKIHPLPLLTADGNGRGGGDYRGSMLADMVGSWKGDLIEVSDKAPEGYTEIFPWFTEIEDWNDEDEARANRPVKRYAVTRYFHTTDTVYVEAASEEEAIELADGMEGDWKTLRNGLQRDGSSDAVEADE